MKPADFRYRRPASIAEAVSIARAEGPGAKFLAGGQSLGPMLNLRVVRPTALIDISAIPELRRSDIDGDEQDGFHSMKVVASYDRDLPIMMLTGGDPILMGAVDAVQESWGLTMVSRSTPANLAGQLAEFLYAAGRRAGCMRLVQI